MADSIFLGSVYATAELRTDSFDKGTKEVNDKLDSLEKNTDTKMAAMGKSFMKAGTALSVGLTAPLLIFGKASFDTAIEVESGWREVQKVYGSTANAFERDSERMHKAVDELSRKFGVLDAEVLDTLSGLAAIGYEGAQAVDMLNQSMEFNLVGRFNDTEKAMSAAVAVAKTYGVQGEELRLMLARMNEAENTSSASMQDLSEAITISGTASKIAGVDIKEFSALMAVFRSRNIAAGEGANALKSIFTRSYGVGRESIEGLLGPLSDANGNLMQADKIIVGLAGKWKGLTGEQKENLAVDVAGLYQKDKFLVLMDSLSQSGSDYDTVIKALSDDTKVLNNYEKELGVGLDSSAIKVAQAKEAWSDLKAQFGEIILVALLPLINALKGLFQWISSLPQGVQIAIVGIMLFLAALGPLLLVVGQIILWWPIIVAGATAFGAVLAFLISPIGLVVLAIVALIAIIFLLWKNWESVSNWLKGVWNAVITWARGAWDSFTKWLKGNADWIVAGLMGIFGGLPAAILGIFMLIWKGINGELTGWPKKLYDWGTNMIKAFGDGIWAAKDWVINKIKDLLEAAKKFVKGNSPPVAGPWKDIDKWGYNVGTAWVEGVQKAIGGMTMPNPDVGITGGSLESTAPAPINNYKTIAPQFTVNLGTFIGTETEKRQLAYELNQSYENYLKGRGR